MEYYFDQLDPTKFQRLINTILVARFGEDARLTPLRGQDGGRDGETAQGNPYLEFDISEEKLLTQIYTLPPKQGRHLFQVKHHRTIDKSLSEVRQAVVSDFKKELEENVISRLGKENVNYFFLITNVPASREAIEKIDNIRSQKLSNIQNLHADVWWQERITSFLDQMSFVWNSFPELFPGGKTPYIGEISNPKTNGISRTIRIAINTQYENDQCVKFRQIELEKNLSQLFVDIDFDINTIRLNKQISSRNHALNEREYIYINSIEDTENIFVLQNDHILRRNKHFSTLSFLLNETDLLPLKKIILEGGPGQGKSTITQMAVQIYRAQLLKKNDLDPENRWKPPLKVRIPFRIELRKFAEWLNKFHEKSVEEYIVYILKQDSGGCEISVDELHTVFEKSRILMIFDGLDEVGSDNLRDEVLTSINIFINRLEKNLDTDLRVIITTRPPALSGHSQKLINFSRLSLAPMDKPRIEEYINRWLSVQIIENDERDRISESFERRQSEPHVIALAKNPMQLSILLQLIKLKGEAFPDRRAELYGEYFKIVIDRDVEKSPDLLKHREVIQALHEFIGYKIHALTEINQADRTLERDRLLKYTREWLINRSGNDESDLAQKFFKLGEERFGLIVATEGEGETNTKYGFAIQPIQEYFAAAFINNQILPENTHKIFEEMINRPYWNEVCLFLAGLRRPNEKADLILRAKKVDQDKQFGWYQNGKNIIFQLLQEGVFSEPPHIFNSALSLILEMLDTRILPIQHEPSNLFSGLENLLQQPLLEQHRDYVWDLLNTHKKVEDYYVMKRLYFVASQIISSIDFQNSIKNYDGQDQELRALIKLGWPYRWKINIESMISDSHYWEEIHNRVCAHVIWNESIESGVASSIKLPEIFHQYFLEFFATKSTNSYLNSPQKIDILKVESNFAIWKFIQCQQILQMLQINIKHINDDNSYEKMIKKELNLICNDEFIIDYVGLSESFKMFLEEIINLSLSVLKSIYNQDQEGKDNAIQKYINSLINHMQSPGLESWVACKCAVNIFLDRNVGIRFPNLERKRNLSKTINNSLKLLAFAIEPFYDDLTKNNNIENRPKSIGSIKNKISKYLFQNPHFPKCILLHEGAIPIPIVDIYEKHIKTKQNLPFEWLNSISLSTDIIHPLVERCPNNLIELLFFFGKHEFQLTSIKLLRVQDTQKIIKIARNTEDPIILSGIAKALISSNFSRIAEIEIILKILQIDNTSFFSSFIFGETKVLSINSDSFVAFSAINIIEEVSQNIFQDPKSYPFYTICQASNFLAQHKKIDLPPLLSIKDCLEITG